MQVREETETVRAILDASPVVNHLTAIYEEEVIPGFALYGMEAEAKAYVTTTLERFRNPFLEHRLADIHQNHRAKLRRRVGDFLEWTRRRDPGFSAPRLDQLLRVAAT